MVNFQGIVAPALAILTFGSVQVCSATSYTVLSYAQIETRIKGFAASRGDLVKLTTAQDEYQIPTVGKCGSSPCLNYILHVTNHSSLNSDPERPEIFFSGALHGDERVGPTATVEFVEQLLKQYGENPWITQLVNTRSIYIMPMTNALGYYQSKRLEGAVDVNRDFPIDSPSSCMNSAAARALNELFRDHRFQLAITFHAGVEMIGFTWGTVTTKYARKNKSPDDTAQIMLGSTMSAYGGKAPGSLYPHGRMNDLIYPVRGGMEDWAYAASWPKNGHSASPCGQTGYDNSRLTYDNDDLRTINVLVETSKEKTPLASAMGTDFNVLVPNGKGDGHVPRNVRLMLFLTDILQPYLTFVNQDISTLTYSWEVGGSMYVDSTYLEYVYVLKNGKRYTKKSSSMKGKSRWSGGGYNSRANARKNSAHRAGRDIQLPTALVDRSESPFIGAFKVNLRLPKGSSLVRVRAIATVDQDWKYNSGAWPKLPPQSHFVNARTNNKWKIEHNGRRITGKTSWASDAICYERTSGVIINCS